MISIPFVYCSLKSHVCRSDTLDIINYIGFIQSVVVVGIILVLRFMVPIKFSLTADGGRKCVRAGVRKCACVRVCVHACVRVYNIISLQNKACVFNCVSSMTAI